METQEKEVDFRDTEPFKELVEVIDQLAKLDPNSPDYINLYEKLNERKTGLSLEVADSIYGENDPDEVNYMDLFSVPTGETDASKALTWDVNNSVVAYHDATGRKFIVPGCQHLGSQLDARGYHRGGLSVPRSIDPASETLPNPVDEAVFTTGEAAISLEWTLRNGQDTYEL